MTIPPVGALPQGTVLYQGRFRIDLLLAQAPQRAVYRAWDLTRDRAATILELATPNEHVANVALDRAAPLVRLDHPAITPFQVIFVEQQTVFIGMGLPGGQTLDRIMAERHAPITPAAAVRWIVQAAEALEFLGRELPEWHLGDVSAAALLVTAEDRIQLLSFELPLGLLLPDEIAALLPDGLVAPELRQGQCDARSDVYALAATLHLLLTRRAYAQDGAVGAESLAEQRPDLPRGLIDAFMRGLAADPAQRWENPAAFYHALLAALPGDRPSADWWLVRDSALTELEEPPTLVTTRDQMRAALAAEAANQAPDGDAFAPKPAAPGGVVPADALVAPDPAPASFATSGVIDALPELPPLECYDEPPSSMEVPPPPNVIFDPFVALNQSFTPAPNVAQSPIEDAQALLAEDDQGNTEVHATLDIAPLLAGESDPAGATLLADPDPAPLPSVHPATAPSRGDYAAAPLGEIAVGALPVAAFLFHDTHAAEPVREEMQEPAPPEPPSAAALMDVTRSDDLVIQAQPPISWLEPDPAPDTPAPEPVAPAPEPDPVPAPEPMREEQIIVAHTAPAPIFAAREPVTPPPLKAAPSPVPASKTPTRPQGMLDRLRALLLGDAMTPTRATGTIVVPRHMYPHHDYTILVRLQCPPGLVEAVPGEAPIALVELEPTTSAFYAPVRRLALPIPIAGGTSEGSITLTALRPTPGGATDRLVFAFRTPEGRALHQGHFIAEVAILSPQQAVSGDPMIALVHALDLS